MCNHCNISEIPYISSCIKEIIFNDCYSLKEIKSIPDTIKSIICYNCPILYLPLHLHKKYRDNVFIPSVKCRNKLSYIYVEFSIPKEFVKEVYMEMYDYNSVWVRDNLYTKYN